MIDTSAILHLLAKKFGTRVKRTNCYDANVCESEFGEDTKWHAKVLSGHPFSQEVRALYRDRRVHVMGNPDYICCSVYGQLDVELCSINRPNKISFVNKLSSLSVCGDPRWPVFLRADQRPSEKLRGLLEDPTFQKTVQEVIRESSESLHLSADSITFYGQRKSAEEVVHAINALSSLVGPYASATISIDFTVLPASLHCLIPLIKCWAVTDDGEREALLEEASESELSDLVATVEPLLGEIDDYVRESAGESLPAIYIGALAECTVEARLFLERLRE